MRHDEPCHDCEAPAAAYWCERCMVRLCSYCFWRHDDPESDCRWPTEWPEED